MIPRVLGCDLSIGTYLSTLPHRHSCPAATAANARASPARLARARSEDLAWVEVDRRAPPGQTGSPWSRRCFQSPWPPCKGLLANSESCRVSALNLLITFITWVPNPLEPEVTVRLNKALLAVSQLLEDLFVWTPGRPTNMMMTDLHLPTIGSYVLPFSSTKPVRQHAKRWQHAKKSRSGSPMALLWSSEVTQKTSPNPWVRPCRFCPSDMSCSWPLSTMASDDGGKRHGSRIGSYHPRPSKATWRLGVRSMEVRGAQLLHSLGD